MAQTVRDVMTAAPIEVSPRALVSDVARRMRGEDIGAVVVTEDGHLPGLVTDRDLTVRVIVEGRDLSNSRVRDACSDEIVSVAPDDQVDRAVHLMRAKAIRRIPVVDPDRDCVVGIVSLGDLAVERDRDSALGDISAAEPNTCHGPPPTGLPCQAGSDVTRGRPAPPLAATATGRASNSLPPLTAATAQRTVRKELNGPRRLYRTGTGPGGAGQP